mmetsp:Transcript_83093/g.144330  ORF Transcript_83093/g.144330 Transcript_83093/m.144330 type:complete len:172 (+) Transcript_83093:73-588(+)
MLVPMATTHGGHVCSEIPIEPANRMADVSVMPSAHSARIVDQDVEVPSRILVPIATARGSYTTCVSTTDMGEAVEVIAIAKGEEQSTSRVRQVRTLVQRSDLVLLPQACALILTGVLRLHHCRAKPVDHGVYATKRIVFPLEQAVRNRAVLVLLASDLTPYELWSAHGHRS